MEEVQATKSDIRADIHKLLTALPEAERKQKTKNIENKLFEFANFLEAKIVLLYINNNGEVPSKNILAKCYDYGKIVVLPAFNTEKYTMQPMKIDDLERDLVPGPRGILGPDIGRCKAVPIHRIDIAVIPGIAFDEKGGRIGSGEGYYDRFIPKLPITTRKVSLVYEEQIVPQVPVESHDKHVDIIITDQRIIYKI